MTENINKEAIKIAYLYEDLMNTYGDSGDVKVLRYLLNQQGFNVQVDNVSIDTKTFDAKNYDFLFFGGGQDFEQTVVAKDLPRHGETIRNYIEAGKPMLAICGGYQLLGDYYKTSDGTTIKGLGILPLHTVFKADARMIGDTKYETEWGTVAAFENHSGRTYFDDKNKLKPLGKMIEGFGNNPEDHVEGMRYKNTIGSYSHGPILKNINVADAIAKMIIQNYQARTQVTMTE
ncbi:type 1 glutamine amidotransferase [Loigolactobacillus backii]|uniref:Lipid II isoglutaminyl synthase (glutamine-hydrolyzing) subunit GatD n=1 Tax=Loigolactobacillus backii TaxID=375175 RepID=A0A192H187_9LACO|nr:cobalamin biosynthesis protein CobQ [Loigolactobacillus backii]ANK60722.1 cobalamin biosynthesis protein CobQ [Loigolactobacillus backii]ANK61711.1 cobalamin biosynthesis protein CobQ [Loigolactobacillus backii]ANK65675.1 cobalamin biosynthesis protein CobQ [Loigolactobacillus backii]ANK68152.1 cobalamin biosynthesis protein CobQ [Loigolactobacillus backii]ANK69092.1 cobalamin biosynthesis protein CobQ [Loigolactobacillus backii]